MDKLFSVANKWFSEYSSQIEYYTMASYRAPLKDVLTYFHGREIQSIKAAEIKSFIGSLAEKGLARQTINLRLIVLRHIFKYAMIDGIIATNEAELVNLPRKLPKTSRIAPSTSTLKSIEEASGNNIYWMLAKCLLYLGGRRGEILALTRDCINFEYDIIRINKQVEFHGNQPHIKFKTKTASSNRLTILPQKLKMHLIAFCNDKEDYIFTTADGKLLSLSMVEDGWKKLGLDCTMHQLRHAYATILYEANIDEKVAQTLMGHSSIVTTRNIYTHVREQQYRAAALQLNNFL